MLWIRICTAGIALVVGLPAPQATSDALHLRNTAMRREINSAKEVIPGASLIGYAGGPAHSLMMIKRTRGGESEIHHKTADIWYVLDGNAEVVTGGALVGGRATEPDEIRGTGIQGGKTATLEKGDVLHVPAGVPHWVKSVRSRAFTYFVVKVHHPAD